MDDNTKTYSFQQLTRALEIGNEITATWAAYNIYLLYPDRLESVLELFLRSPFVGVKEVGINEISESRVDAHSFQLLSLFREGSGVIKQSTALALSRFPNDMFIAQLTAWFEELICLEDVTPADFYSGSVAFLRIDPIRHPAIALQKLAELDDANLKRAWLSRALIENVADLALFAVAFEAYFSIRVMAPTLEIPGYLATVLEHTDLIDWMHLNLEQNASVDKIYMKSVILLEMGIGLEERSAWEQISESYKKWSETGEAAEVAGLLQALKVWQTLQAHTASLNNYQQKALKIIEGFAQHAEGITEINPKILQYELSILISIPLLFHLQPVVEGWLENIPEKIDQIATYYHSSLLTEAYRERILNFFFENAPKWNPEDLRITTTEPHRLEASTSELIWNLYRGEYLGKNIPWPTLLPHPNVGRQVVSCLVQIYKVNFDFFVEQCDHLSIDYALQLFQTLHDKHSTALIVQHFDFLYRHHNGVLSQTLGYCATPECLDLLLGKFKPGESELAELIVMISDLFEQPVPQHVLTKADDYDGLYVPRFRLTCQNCSEIYKYTTGKIYVDESAINRNESLTNETIWITKHIHCKQCASPIDLCLNEAELESLTSDVRLSRTFRMSTNPAIVLIAKNFVIIPFPVFEGRVYKPDAFERFVLEQNQLRCDDPLFQISMLLKLVRVYANLGEWGKILKVLENAVSEGQFLIAVYYYRGVAHFHLEHIREARAAFNTIIDTFGQKECSEYEKIYLTQARGLLHNLNTSAVQPKFEIIAGGKE